MRPIRSESRQRGLTLTELMLVIMLSLVVMLGAGTIYRGVDHTFRTNTRKLVAQKESSLLSTVISRRVRTASNFMIYDVADRTAPVDAGNGLALLDGNGVVTYRLEWDNTNQTLADSTGARVTAMNLQNLLFSADPVSPKTVRYVYQTYDGIGNLVDIQSAASLRN
ncbi:MAG: prepilin-type N-terminal cleavage/methylation domain-containing protein [bacterium]|nr:prepilin-type N-terminal cleavage/methylation domain-containing protein [bacterium]